MKTDDWKKLAAFGVTLWAISLWNEQAAVFLGGTALAVILIKNPHIITNPLGLGD